MLLNVASAIMGRTEPLYMNDRDLHRFEKHIIAVSGCLLYDGKTSRYGRTYVYDKKKRIVTLSAHRVAWIKDHGPIPPDKLVLHKCPGGANKGCCIHLYLGDSKDNARDRDAEGKGRAGKIHWSKLHPERNLVGDRNPSRTRPECLARGKQNGKNTHPEKIKHGEDHANAKMTWANARRIRLLYKPWSKFFGTPALARRYHVSQRLIFAIVTNQIWVETS